ncbi:zinc-binding oxidoreductase ToxD [Pseudohyphozyma bogoriensis]|nr:zinc-binding oxidoreductase ToxD [Pseudohyphozyma bogoriensis]
MTAVPSTYKALVVTSKGFATLQSVPRPPLGPLDIRVHVKAVALNPTDWRHLHFISPVGAILGCDFAGQVVEIGSDVVGMELGIRVAGIVHGGLFEDQGAYAEYVKVHHTFVWEVPAELDWEEAAALGGVAPHTVFQTLYYNLRLAPPSNPTKAAPPVLIWGGSTAVGMAAIQLAKASGYTVITPTSAKNRHLAHPLGADAVFDYTDASTPSLIAAAYPDLTLGVDTVGSCQLVARSFASHEGTIAKLLPPVEGDNDGHGAIKVIPTFLFTLFGSPFSFLMNDGPLREFPAHPEEKAAFEKWVRFMPELVEKGLLRPPPLWKRKGGLEKVLEGMQIIKEGGYSAQKLTYKI